MNTVNAVALWELSPSVPLPLYFLSNPQQEEKTMPTESFLEKENLVKRISALKVEVSEREELRKQLEEKLIKLLEADLYPLSESFMLQEKYDEEVFITKVTVVRPTSIDIDEEGLKNELKPSQWKAITTLSLDKKKLEDNVARGKIDIDVVAKNSTEKPKKPYLKITHSKKALD